jgi:hypothetical protein
MRDGASLDSARRVADALTLRCDDHRLSVGGTWRQSAAHRRERIDRADVTPGIARTLDLPIANQWQVAPVRAPRAPQVPRNQSEHESRGQTRKSGFHIRTQSKNQPIVKMTVSVAVRLPGDAFVSLPALAGLAMPIYNPLLISHSMRNQPVKR